MDTGAVVRVDVIAWREVMELNKRQVKKLAKLISYASIHHSIGVQGCDGSFWDTEEGGRINMAMKKYTGDNIIKMGYGEVLGIADIQVVVDLFIRKETNHDN